MGVPPSKAYLQFSFKELLSRKHVQAIVPLPSEPDGMLGRAMGGLALKGHNFFENLRSARLDALPRGVL